MNKGKKLMLAVLSVSLLTGCSKFSPDENAVSVGKDGEITAAVLEQLDQSYYDGEELRSDVEGAVAEYNSSEEDQITIDRFEISEEGAVELFMTYADGEDYAAFNNVDFYVGDITGGYNDGGYRFETGFCKVENGEVTETDVARETIFAGSNHPMVVFSEEMEVEVPGNILYVSENVEVTGKKSARMGSGQAESETESETEGTSESDTDIPEIEPEQVTADVQADSDTTLAYIIYE